MGCLFLVWACMCSQIGTLYILYMRVLAFLIEQRFFLSLFFFFNLGSLEICAVTYILQLQNVPLYANTSLQFSTEMAVSDNKAQTTFTVEVYQLM